MRPPQFEVVRGVFIYDLSNGRQHGLVEAQIYRGEEKDYIDDLVQPRRDYPQTVGDKDAHVMIRYAAGLHQKPLVAEKELVQFMLPTVTPYRPYQFGCPA